MASDIRPSGQSPKAHGSTLSALPAIAATEEGGQPILTTDPVSGAGAIVEVGGRPVLRTDATEGLTVLVVDGQIIAR